MRRYLIDFQQIVDRHVWIEAVDPAQAMQKFDNMDYDVLISESTIDSEKVSEDTRIDGGEDIE